MLPPIHFESYTTVTGTLLLAVPDEAALQATYTAGSPSNFPFWARRWPSALALAQYLSQNPAYILDKKVLELAAGLGLPSLVAAGYAAQVTASDYAPEAVELIRLSARQSGIRNLSALVINWNDPLDVSDTEVLLLSDVNYAKPDLSRLFQLIGQCMEQQLIVILATPHRLQAKPFMEELLPWRITHAEIEAEGEMISVWVMKTG